MLSKKEAIIFVLLGLARNHNKTYCFPSQRTILRLLKKFYQVTISRRHLNRILKILEAEGILERIRRLRKGIEGKIVFCSTLYKFKGKLFNLLFKMKNRLNGLFSFFRVPKWSHYKTKGRQRSPKLSIPPELIWDEDG